MDQIQLTIFVHADLDALAQAACPALIAVRLVHQTGAFALGLAQVLPIAADGSLREEQNKFQTSSSDEKKVTQYLEESGAAVAGKDAVVLAGRMVLAHSAGDVVEDAAGRSAAGRLAGRRCVAEMLHVENG